LQKDNDELREFIKVQRQRIEELTNKVSNLAKQIEKTHQVPSTTIDYENRNVKKKLCFIDDSSKKPRFNNQNISSTTTDYSTTLLDSDSLTEDDIIQEAESRLKTLEINTAKVEQNLKKFQLNRSHHNTDFKLIRDNSKSYNKMRSNFSDYSDKDALKRSSNKINLKEVANKIGYRRSIRRSLNQSQSENDTSPEILRNTKLQDYTNSTNISPIKLLSPRIRENFTHKELPVNKVNLRTDSTINKSNMSTQSTKEQKLQIESNTTNTLLPDTNNDVHNNDNVGIQLTKNVESPQKRTYVQQDISNKVDTLSMTKKLQESDHSISFGSNKTDKSSDFWA